MQAVIVEDSRLARNELKHLLQAFDYLEVVAEAANADEAQKLIESRQPDLLFLDIQMPGRDGFQLLESLEYMPEVIFTTAYNDYAIKAFDYNALDYLMKPIEPKRLAAALQKIQGKIQQKKQKSETKLSETDQVFVKDGDKCWFVKLADIKLFEAADNYTRVYFDNFQPMIHRTLNYLENRLDERKFFRANRQQIVNVQWIERIEPWFSGGLKVFLKGGGEVEISRRQTLKFKDLMSF
ncbi:MAG: LytTR family DNA-binding domain-containing protein [Microscillaceae bacterium]|nr:LytTR family DNA-binding domain-containing protein [Microscillaceae bacterium]